MRNNLQKLGKYYILTLYGREHVLVKTRRKADIKVRQPNFLNTGLALIGILKEGESIIQWEKRVQKVRKKLDDKAREVV